MLRLEMKTSPRLVQQIAAIERFSGVWDRVAALEQGGTSRNSLVEVIRNGSLACLELDTSSPPGMSFHIERFGASSADLWLNNEVEDNPLRFLINAHLHNSEFDMEGLKELFHVIAGKQAKVFREEIKHFTAPQEAAHLNSTQNKEVIFSTVSPFLVEKRLGELLEWLQQELEDGTFHPLFIIGTFHLLLLQIHPFHSANHRLALVCVWRLLDAHGYGFVRSFHFASEILVRRKQYFAALRQAEKTASANWSTLNVWLEFFLDVLIASCENICKDSQDRASTARLSGVQKQIIEVIKRDGSATREKIVTETGINISTVKYNLSVLATKGHLKRAGGGRGTSYSIL